MNIPDRGHTLIERYLLHNRLLHEEFVRHLKFYRGFLEHSLGRKVLNIGGKYPVLKYPIDPPTPLVEVSEELGIDYQVNYQFTINSRGPGYVLNLIMRVKLQYPHSTIFLEDYGWPLFDTDNQGKMTEVRIPTDEVLESRFPLKDQRTLMKEVERALHDKASYQLSLNALPGTLIRDLGFNYP